MFREVSGYIEWGSEVLQDKEEEGGVQHNQTSNSTLIFLPPSPLPDPGFFQNPTTDDEIVGVINLKEVTDIEIGLLSFERNVCLDMKGTGERYPPGKRVKFDTYFFCNYEFDKKVILFFIVLKRNSGSKGLTGLGQVQFCLATSKKFGETKSLQH